MVHHLCEACVLKVDIFSLQNLLSFLMVSSLTPTSQLFIHRSRALDFLIMTALPVGTYYTFENYLILSVFVMKVSKKKF